MIWFRLAVAIIFIIIGSRLGGVGVGLAGGAGCIVLAATGLHTKVAEDIPWTVIGIIMTVIWTVIGIIMTVICAIAALQLAGGMDYLVHLTEVMLRKNPTTSIILRRYQRSSSPCCVALDIPHILCCLSSSKWRRSTRSDRRDHCP